MLRIFAHHRFCMRELGCDWKFQRREMNFGFFDVAVDEFAD